MILLQLFILIILSSALTAMLIFFGRSIMFMIPILHGPVFVPSKQKDIANMIKLAKIKKGERIIDMGAGDGEIVIALAKAGYKAEGCEINPVLIRKAQKRIKKLGLEKKAKVYYKNFWDLDFSDFDVVFLYGTSYIMNRLEKKLLDELRPGSRLVSNYFQLPNWQSEKSIGKIRVYRK